MPTSMMEKSVTRHVILYCDSDSQLFGVTSFVSYFLDAGWSVSIRLDAAKSISVAVLAEYEYRHLMTEASYAEFLNEVRHTNADAVGFFSRASIIAKFRIDLEQISKSKSGERFGIFTGFNGLSYEKSEEGIAWRLGYDVLCLNGPRDQDLFANFVVDTPFASQPLEITGIRPQPNKRKALPPTTNTRNLVFAEQLLAPASYEARLYLARQLLRIARENPKWDVIAKCRTARSESTFHFQTYYFPDVLKKAGRIPDNLKVSFEPMTRVLKECNLFLSVSSTALIDAYRQGIPIAAISDFGVQNNQGSHLFVGSGLEVNLFEIDQLDNFDLLSAQEAWVQQIGIEGFDPKGLISKLENTVFVWGDFEKPYYTEADLQRFQDLAKKSLLNVINASILRICSFLTRSFLIK